jgi:tRNA(Ile)-lysidine synthase
MTGAPDLTAEFAKSMARLVPDSGARRLGLAVSGGSDSMALMTLAAQWGGAQLWVATVDHGLRRESATEAQTVAKTAARLGLPHATLHWQEWSGRGNLQDAARQARRRLLAQWAASEGLDAVLLGHTRDDQAETVLMRLARGSGVDGLAAMPARFGAHGLLWLRPLLDMARADLRDWLLAQGLHWADDPSNENPDFDRVKARHLRALLAPLGLSDTRLAETAARMAEARQVLELAADTAQAQLRQDQHGDILFDAKGLDALPADTRYRLFARALCEIASSPYRPRMKALRAAIGAHRATLHGCLITRAGDSLRITREAQAVARLRAPFGQIWDRRWQITAPPDTLPAQDLHIAALGENGLALCPDQAGWLLPRPSLLASPAVWHGARLVAAPLAGLGPGWQASLCQTDTGPGSAAYSH